MIPPIPAKILLFIISALEVDNRTRGMDVNRNRPERNQVSEQSIPKFAALHRVLGALTTPLCLMVLLTSFSGTAYAGDDGTLLFVRDWSAETGKLIGWLPAHQAVLFLQLEDRNADTSFDLNEAVAVNWINGERGIGGVRVSPEPREFDGQKWLPMRRDANLVRIKKRVFLIRGINFGDSVYKRATKVASR